MKTTTWNHRRLAGFSLLELTVAIAILGIVMGALTGVLDSSRKGYTQGSTEARVQLEARRAIDRIAGEFENAGLGTLIPSPVGVANSDLVFQIASGFNVVNNTITFDPSSRLRFVYEPGELNNGLDDDGDGLIDEGEVVLTRNYLQPGEISTTLVHGVPELLDGETANGVDDNGNGLADERGFCMTLQGSLLILRLSLVRPVAGGLSVVATVQTSVRLKN